MITPAMLIKALRLSEHSWAYSGVEGPPGDLRLDGWFDVIKMAKLLNEELGRRAQPVSMEPVHIDDIDVSTKEGA
jgi:hypothetical protein